MFYADLYGSFGPLASRRRHQEGTFEPPRPQAAATIAKMVLARRYWAYGAQSTYFDDPRCVGFTRHGDLGFKSDNDRSDGGGGGDGGGAGLAVLLSAAGSYSLHPYRATKNMYVGVRHAGESWTDILRKEGEEDVVIIDEHGCGTFSVGPRSVAVWVDVAAKARDVVDGFKL